MAVSIGDKVIIFENKYGDKTLLGKGVALAIGDIITVHTTNNDDWITHGKSQIAIGDKVTIVDKHE